MHILNITLLLIFLEQWSSVRASRILAVFPAPAHSHQITFRALLKGLHQQGHDLVVLTTNPLLDKAPKENYKEIDLSFLYQEAQVEGLTNFNKHYRIFTMYYMLKSLETLAEQVYNVSEFQALIHNDQFDLVLVEISSHSSFFALSERFNCPSIGIRSLGLRVEAHDLISNPVTPSYISIAFMENDHGFFGRVVNSLMVLYIRCLYKYFYLPRAEVITKLNYPNHNTYIGDLEKNLSLVFIGTHPIISGPRPLVPKAIEIGGIHLPEMDTEITDDIKSFLDKSKNGAILFSFGSLVSFAYLPNEVLETILSALSELPYNVLLKTDVNVSNFKLENIKIVNWTPQYAVLGHPNIKLFISHGGLNSVMESIACEVPMVAIPFHTDQFHNAHRIELLGVGTILNYNNLTKDNLVSAVMKVITNSSYQDNIIKIASQIRDQPMSPLKKAIFWTEYVLRHNGAPHLKTAADDQSWIVYYLIDVFIFLTFVIILILVILKCLITFLYNCYVTKSKYKPKSE